MAHGALEKLLSVSKLFADQRVSELMAENRQLKLSLFWKNYGVERLEKAMSYANRNYKGPDCYCVVCAVSGRKDDLPDDRTPGGIKCIFKPYFDRMVEECGLVVSNAMAESALGIAHECNETGSRVYDEDCHLIPINRSDWLLFTYGARLWKAKSVDDPELQKLRKLLELLEEEAYTTDNEDSMDEAD